ncbi:hypothetical protein BASA81_002563 [Batrachochytrium salamandrivorans]|nr:hypothetical protein BASA81_002563 [Batrachochytrium salamandrivorans]
MAQKSLGSGKKAATQIKRKNAPQKRKAPTFHDRKGTKALNKILETKAAAKALRVETKFNFGLQEFNAKGKQQMKDDDAQKIKRQAKKRKAADRQNGAFAPDEEHSFKRAKNDLE